ncbi:hypothetical protein GQ53DRAFT_881869 [Thozetella sp. PMI_491]|nr:hypothetical protein GQ53DRAFT_881869 [Thozetella sp. PMI_491]
MTALNAPPCIQEGPVPERSPNSEHIEGDAPSAGTDSRLQQNKSETAATHSKRELKEADEYSHLGYSFPTWKNEQAARVPQLAFLCAYSIGCELWTTWSEELGRWSTQQLSLLLVNIWQFPCAFAPNYATLIVCRLLGGLSTADGSVTLGVLADMWEPKDQEYAIAWLTRAIIVLDRVAKKRRKNGEDVWGPNEIKGHSLSFREIMPSAVSGFSDNLILSSFKASNQLLFGYFFSYLSFLPSIHVFRQRRRKKGPCSATPEARLWWLRYVILLEPIGLIGFAWTSLGPPHVHWIAPMIFTSLVGIANYAIYQSSIDYTVAAYGVYAASATGGNDFAPLLNQPLEYASTFLAILTLCMTLPLFYFYKKGPEIRSRSKFAVEIDQARKQDRGGRPKTEGEEPTIPEHEHV